MFMYQSLYILLVVGFQGQLEYIKRGKRIVKVMKKMVNKSQVKDFESLVVWVY